MIIIVMMINHDIDCNDDNGNNGGDVMKKWY